MKAKPDDRRDNVDKIQQNINNTMENIHRADEMIEKTSDQKMKKTLADKNDRRQNTLDALREEIKDEANHNKNS